jgi:hypothetical protein
VAHASRSRTQLISGEIIDGAILNVWLVRQDQDESIMIMWPTHPTQCSSRKFSDVCAVACRLLANASTELSRLKAGTRR